MEFGVIFDSIFFFVFFNLIIFIEKRVLSIIIIVENKVSNEKYTMNAKTSWVKNPIVSPTFVLGIQLSY